MGACGVSAATLLSAAVVPGGSAGVASGTGPGKIGRATGPRCRTCKRLAVCAKGKGLVSALERILANLVW